MTTRQQEALDFIRAKQRVVTIGPSLRELAAALGIAANAAQQKVEFLRREGIVATNTGQGIVLTSEGILSQQVSTNGIDFVAPRVGGRVSKEKSEALARAKSEDRPVDYFNAGGRLKRAFPDGTVKDAPNTMTRTERKPILRPSGKL